MELKTLVFYVLLRKPVGIPSHLRYLFFCSRLRLSCMEPNLCATFPSNYTFAILLIKTTSKRRKSKPTFFAVEPVFMPHASQAENERFNLSEYRKKMHFFIIMLTFLRAVVAGVIPACSSLGFISFVIFSTSLIHIQGQDNMFFVRYFSHLATFCRFICSNLKYTKDEIMQFFSL